MWFSRSHRRVVGSTAVSCPMAVVRCLMYLFRRPNGPMAPISGLAIWLFSQVHRTSHNSQLIFDIGLRHRRCQVCARLSLANEGNLSPIFNWLPIDRQNSPEGEPLYNKECLYPRRSHSMHRIIKISCAVALLASAAVAADGPEIQ